MAKQQLTALIMAGGTGGHIFPGIAIAKMLAKQGWKVCWLGAKGGMEERLVSNEAIALSLISVSGLRGNGLAGWLKAPFSISKAVLEALKIFREINPSVVIGCGGFASGPGGLAAFLTRTPLLIHEQNAVAGLTNRVLAKLAKRVFQAFSGAFKNSPKVETVGNPLRAEIVVLNQRDLIVKNQQQVINILVMGGSRGALALNQNLPGVFAQLLKEHRLSIVHQVGSQRLGKTQQYYCDAQIDEHKNIQLIEFIDDMPGALEWADIVICRSGASTVSEIAAAGNCAIFIPFPYAVDDHQTANANWLVSQQAGLIFKEEEIQQVHFIQEIKRLINSPQQIHQMAINAKQAAKLNAAEKVAEYCEMLRGKAA